jgi:hypothetical protein
MQLAADARILSKQELDRRKQGFEVLLWLGSAGVANATPGIGTLVFEPDNLRKDFADLKARGVKFLEATSEA